MAQGRIWQGEQVRSGEFQFCERREAEGCKGGHRGVGRALQRMPLRSRFQLKTLRGHCWHHIMKQGSPAAPQMPITSLAIRK